LDEEALNGDSACRWEDTVKMYVTEIGFEGVDWIQMSYDRVQW
jgi:hypothetical protein